MYRTHMDYTLREKIKILPFVLWVKWLFPHLDCTHRSCGYFLVGIVCGSCGSCLSNRLSYPLALGMSTGSTIWVQTAYPRKHLIWRLVFSPSQNSGKEKLLRKAWYSSFKSFFLVSVAYSCFFLFKYGTLYLVLLY